MKLEGKISRLGRYNVTDVIERNRTVAGIETSFDELRLSRARTGTTSS